MQEIELETISKLKELSSGAQPAELSRPAAALRIPTGLEALSPGDRFFRKGLSGRGAGEFINLLGLIAIWTAAESPALDNQIMRVITLIIGLVSAALVTGTGAFQIIESLDNAPEQTRWRSSAAFLIGLSNAAAVGFVSLAANLIAYASSNNDANTGLTVIAGGGWMLAELINIVLAVADRPERVRLGVELIGGLLKIVGIIVMTFARPAFAGSIIAACGVCLNGIHGMLKVRRAVNQVIKHHRPPDSWTRWLGPSARVTDALIALCAALSVGLAIVIGSSPTTGTWPRVALACGIASAFLVLGSGGWDFLGAIHRAIYMNEFWKATTLILRGLAKVIGGGLALAAGVLLFLTTFNIRLPSWDQSIPALFFGALIMLALAELMNAVYQTLRLADMQFGSPRWRVILIGVELAVSIALIVFISLLTPAFRATGFGAAGQTWPNPVMAVVWMSTQGVLVVGCLLALRSNSPLLVWRRVYVHERRPDQYDADETSDFLEQGQFDKVTARQLQVYAQNLRQQKADLEHRHNMLKDALETLTRAHDQLKRERDDLAGKRDQLKRERDDLINERDNLTAERDRINQSLSETQTALEAEGRNHAKTRTDLQNVQRQKEQADEALQAERAAHKQTQTRLDDCLKSSKDQ